MAAESSGAALISWTFAAAVLALAALPAGLPPAARTAALAALSIAGASLVWSVPVAWVLAAAVATWGLGALLARLDGRARSAALAAGIVSVLLALAWLRSGRSGRDSLVPTTTLVGLSYFALKFVQHLVDSAAGRTRDVGVLDLVASIFFLPTFAAGPIERTGELSRKLAEPPLAWSERVLGIERVLVGLAKKLVLGDRLLAFAEPAFAHPEFSDRGTLWLAVYAFALALYLDFAGYSDIAIGAGRLAGIRVRENFESPYLQPNLAQLWQHWHMSLTGWLRDYVFVPVARRTLRATKRPLLSQGVAQTATMLACGLWHGIAWNFVAWGLYHALFLTALAAWRGRGGATPAPAAGSTADRRARVLGALASFHFFAFGLLLFGCSVRGAGRYVARMFGVDGLP